MYTKVIGKGPSQVHGGLLLARAPLWKATPEKALGKIIETLGSRVLTVMCVNSAM